MTIDDAFSLLNTFFTERKAARLALGHLRENIEIGIVIGEGHPCAVFRQGSDIVLERRTAVKPDFVFSLQPETISILVEQTKDEVGDIGLGVIKQMLAGNIRVQLQGGLLSVLRNGYIEIIASGGAPVAKMLAGLGLGTPGKLYGLFKKLRD